MDSFTETSLRSFCATHDSFGQPSIFLHFEKKTEDNENGYGYNSSLIFGRIIYKSQQKEKISTPLALKSMPSGHPYPDYNAVQFFNEIFFYTRALPALQHSDGLQKLLTKFYDSYIHSSAQITQILLIYEDLQALGFRNYKRFLFLDFEHLTLMLRRLGQFHSFSYLAKAKNPKEFSGLGNWFHYAEAELIRTRPDHFRLFGEIGVARLRLDPRYCGRLAKVEEVLQRADNFMLQVNTQEQEGIMSVLCHGDFLKENVMFRYESGQPVDMKILDLATCRIASPVIDLSLVLYLNADQQTRSQHWDQLIDAYYEGLCLLGTGVPCKESILKEFTTKALNGYFIASHFLPYLIRMDRQPGDTSTVMDYLPPEYHVFDVPEKVFKDAIKEWCSVESAELVADVLRDMIDRNFI